MVILLFHRPRDFRPPKRFRWCLGCPCRSSISTVQGEQKKNRKRFSGNLRPSWVTLIRTSSNVETFSCKYFFTRLFPPQGHQRKFVKGVGSLNFGIFLAALLDPHRGETTRVVPICKAIFGVKNAYKITGSPGSTLYVRLGKWVPQADDSAQRKARKWMELKNWEHVGVSLNDGTPKSSILIGSSIINHPFWGIPIFGNTHVNWQCFCWYFGGWIFTMNIWIRRNSVWDSLFILFETNGDIRSTIRFCWYDDIFVIVSRFFIAFFWWWSSLRALWWMASYPVACHGCTPENYDKSGALYCKVKLIRRSWAKFCWE